MIHKLNRTSESAEALIDAAFRRGVQLGWRECREIAAREVALYEPGEITAEEAVLRAAAMIRSLPNDPTIDEP